LLLAEVIVNSPEPSGFPCIAIFDIFFP